jgi:transketolase
MKMNADMFVVSEIPLKILPQELLNSLASTKKVLIIEEHVRRGGLGEHLASLFLEHRIAPRTVQRFAVGYPDSLYGSQSYHQKASGLDAASLSKTIKELADEQ